MLSRHPDPGAEKAPGQLDGRAALGRLARARRPDLRRHAPEHRRLPGSQGPAGPRHAVPQPRLPASRRPSSSSSSRPTWCGRSRARSSRGRSTVSAIRPTARPTSSATSTGSTAGGRRRSGRRSQGRLRIHRRIADGLETYHDCLECDASGAHKQRPVAAALSCSPLPRRARAGRLQDDWMIRPESPAGRWSIRSQRHPILVSQEPTTHLIRVARGSNGLTPSQRAQLLDFAEHSRATDAGNSRLVIAVPSGAANEVAAMHAVGEIRALLTRQRLRRGIDRGRGLQRRRRRRSADPRLLSALRRRGRRVRRLVDQPRLRADEPAVSELRLRQQRNLAAHGRQSGRPARPAHRDRRAARAPRQVWDKYVNGEPTGARKTSTRA